MIKLIVSLLTVASFVVGITLGLAIFYYFGHYAEKDYLSNSDYELKADIDHCRGLNLGNTSQCLREYITEIYNYSMSMNLEENLTKIKQNGGDCSEYSLLYKKAGEYLGFTSYLYIIEPKELEYGHAFTVISSREGYCLLDLTADSCFYFDVDLIEEEYYENSYNE